MTQESSDFAEYISVFSSGDYESIKKLVSSEDFDINRTDISGATILHHVVELNNVQLIKYILDLPGVNINAQTHENGATPMIIASKKGHFEALNCLLARGADAYINDYEGFSVLMAAAKSGSVDCLDALLNQRQLNINLTNKLGNNALMEGAKYPEIVRRLINFTDLSHENLEGFNALHFACLGGSIEVASMILEKSFINLNKQDKNGNIPVYVAIKEQHFDLVDYLIAMGANMLTFNKSNLCGYHFIVIYDDSELYLYKHQYPANLTTSIFGIAVEHNRPKTFKIFIDKLFWQKGPDKYELMKCFNCALKVAAIVGNLECAKILVATNMISEDYYESSMIEALKKNHYECFKYIYDNIPSNMTISKKNLLSMAAVFGCFEACKLLLEQGMEPNGTNSVTYLILASIRGNLDIVELFLDHGADIDRVHEHGTALALATINKFPDVVNYLLEKGANYNLQDSKGYTPLIRASDRDNLELFNMIFEKDKNIHHKTKTGVTAFLASCSSSNLDVVKKLIESGANIYDTNNCNDNCLHLAAENIKSLQIFIYSTKLVQNLDEMLNSKNDEGKTPLHLIVQHANSSYLSRIISEHPAILKHFDSPKSIEIGEGNICSICKNKFKVGEHPFLLHCNHIFHQECFIDYFESNEKCPNCKNFPFKLKSPFQEDIEDTESSCCCIS